MFGKLAVLALVMMLALGAVGIAFAGWGQELSMDGTATTGTVQLEFTGCVTSDNEAPGMDTGSTTAQCLDIDGDGVEETLQVDIQRGYAGYAGIVDFEVRNAGTVPVHVSEILLPGPVNGIAFDVTGITVGDQIHPGDTLAGRLTIELETQVSGVYEFALSIVAVNWNEEVRANA